MSASVPSTGKNNYRIKREKPATRRQGDLNIEQQMRIIMIFLRWLAGILLAFLTLQLAWTAHNTKLIAAIDKRVAVYMETNIISAQAEIARIDNNVEGILALEEKVDKVYVEHAALVSEIEVIKAVLKTVTE